MLRNAYMSKYIICFLESVMSQLPAGSCRRRVERRRGNRPSRLPEPQTASPQSYGAELDWYLMESEEKSWRSNVSQTCRRGKNGARGPPCSFMVAMVTLAADREWTFLCRRDQHHLFISHSCVLSRFLWIKNESKSKTEARLWTFIYPLHFNTKTCDHRDENTFEL